MTDSKPDCLPFIELPIPREDSITAGCYLIKLELDHGPLGLNEVSSVLTGEESDFDLNARQRGIIRQVSQVIASELPHFLKYDPTRILGILERA